MGTILPQEDWVMAGNIHMTRHALQRALDMLITPKQIQAVLESPKVLHSKQDPNKQYWRKGRIVLVVQMGATPSVVTVLWATEKAFERDMKRAPYSDRSMDAFAAAWA